MILHDFIKDDDTPFVYERLGTLLNHLLIDEFQDTSEMQWVNLRPLVMESLSRGNDSGTCQHKSRQEINTDFHNTDFQNIVCNSIVAE